MLPIFLLVLFIPTSLLAADFLPGASVPPLRQRGILHQEKTHIVDSSGHPVKLRGVNVNGWLLWEGWVWGGWFESETKILTKLERLVGTEEVKHFQQQVYEKFIGERDIERMSALGFNMVRIPINHRLLEEDENPFVYKESGWQILDRVLRWCEQYRVYAVLDLHSAPGGQGDLFTVDPEGKGKLWGSGIHQERTIALWKAVASRYKDSAVVAAYDILNEPQAPSSKVLLELYRRIIASIREVDPNHLIMLEGDRFSTDFSLFKAPLTDNQVFSFHMYTWFSDKRRKLLDRYRRIAEEQAVPMWNGEFGENRYEMLESTVKLFEQSEYDLSGWAFLPWKKVKTRYPSLREIRAPAAWKAVIGWVSNPFRKRPSREAALEGMRQFLKAIQFEETVENPRMVEFLTTR